MSKVSDIRGNLPKGWQSIPGWFSFGHAYDEMVATAKDGDVIVEVGVAFGRSLAYLARKVIDSGKRIDVIGVDPWCPEWTPSGRDWDKPATSQEPVRGWGGEYAELVERLGGPYEAFYSLMVEYAPEELAACRIWRVPSAEGAARISHMLGNRQTVHGVLIDANHDYEHVKADIEAWLPLVKDGGIIAGDDYQADEFPGVVRAVNERFTCAEVKGTTWLQRVRK